MMSNEIFSDGELDLLQSFEEQFQRNGMLSLKQIYVLEDIYKKVQGR